MKSGQVRSSIADVAAGAKKNGILPWLRAPGSRWQRICRLGEAGGAAILAVCVGLFLFWSRHWPLVNDPALMHYVVFLMERGMAPYREIGDINLPGAYAPEWVSMSLAHLLHVSEAAMWRLMDALALLLAGWAMARIARPYSWFAGVWAGALFALYHGRDGIGQAGQRDLWVAVLLLWAVSVLFEAMRRNEPSGQGWRVACFGLLIGASITIKPFGAGWLVCLIPLLLREKRLSARLALVGWVGLGLALPLLAALFFLSYWHAVTAFWRVLHVDLPYYAGLADGSVLQLVLASSISSALKLVCLLLVAAVINGRWRESWAALTMRPLNESAWTVRPERLLLILCILLGLGSFVAQGKGFSYQRYPYVAFLFLFAGLEFAESVRSGRKAPGIIGVAGFAFGVLLCAPSYLRAAYQSYWPISVTQAMESALAKQAGVAGVQSLDGNVQCIDAVSGCTDALLHLHLEQTTGTMYDEFLFPQAPAPWGPVYLGWDSGLPLPVAVAAERQRFRAEWTAHTPQVVIVSSWLFLEGPGEYRKLVLWPWFDAYLREHYTLVSEQKFARAENGPLGFRVYVRRDSALH